MFYKPFNSSFAFHICITIFFGLNILTVSSNKPCSDGNRYESLNICTTECRFILSNHNFSGLHVPASQKKIKYKLVILSAKEFILSSNGSIISTLPTSEIPANSYVMDSNNSTAYICYPFDQDFINCPKWTLDEEDFILSNDSKYLLVEGFKNYTLGEFYIDKIEATTCVSVDALEHDDKRKIEGQWFMAIHLISAVSLLFTFICSVRFPQLNLRRNYILLCHMSIMSIAYWVLVIDYIMGQSKKMSTACVALALIKQFSFLATFFWINVQAIDLYLRFNKLSCNVNSKASNRRFLYYSVYAWGGSFVITSISLIMDISNAPFRPKFEEICWFDRSNRIVGFLYFYLIIVVILIANIVLFILTIIKLYNLGKNASSVNKHIYKQLLQLYIKLFLIMGLCWIMEVISWGTVTVGDESRWYFTDAINGFQGLFISIIYLAKPSCIKKLWQSMPCLGKWYPSRQDDQDQSGKFSKSGQSIQTEATTSNSSVQQTNV